ncbi:MAG: cyclase family protein [Elusimicrobiota bacterium]
MIIDLSLPIANKPSEPDSAKITYISHTCGAKRLINGAFNVIAKKNLLKGLLFKLMTILRSCGVDRIFNLRLPALTYKDFPNEMGLANEDITLDTHTGTHMDAPWHFGPLLVGQKPKTIDKIPLEWCYSDGVLLDMRHKKPEELISEADITNALFKIGYKLKPYDIVLIMTGADRHFNDGSYFSAHPGMSAEATIYLIRQGIKIIGIDAWGFDKPAMKMLSDYLKTRDKSSIFPAHFVGRKYEYCHIEQLSNLDKIPKSHGFKVACFPVKIENAGAGWCRAVAII